MHDFDRRFNRVFSLAWIGVIVGMIVSLAVLAGLGWAAYRLINHFCV
jgi:hypothetical protein